MVNRLETVIAPMLSPLDEDLHFAEAYCVYSISAMTP